MPQKTSPFIDFKYGWNLGESGWNGGMDYNMLISSFLLNPVIDSLTETLPPATNGAAYFRPSDNSFYLGVGSSWTVVPCPSRFIFKVKSTGAYYTFDGISATQVLNFQEIEAELSSQQSTIGSLGTAAFVDTADFVQIENLDVLDAQLSQSIEDVRDDLLSQDDGKGASLVAYNPDGDFTAGSVGYDLKFKPTTRPDRIQPPVGMEWNPPLAVYTNTSGEVSTDFDVRSYRLTGNGKYCWVDPVNGSDANGGSTEATAKKNLSVAIADPAITTIYIVAGAMFDRDSVAGVFNGWGSPLTTNKNIICPNGRAKLTMRHPNSTWTSQGSGVYTTTRSNTVSVYDTTSRDEFGDYLKIPQVALVSDLATVDQGWTLSGSTLYVKRLDGQSPTRESTAIFLTSDPNRPGSVRGNVKVYLENLDFEGGDAAFDAATTNSADKLEVYAYNCTFKYSVTLNGLNIEGASKVYLQNCVASNNRRDGFNYHYLAGVTGPGQAIEVNCVGRRNGLGDSNQNNNGSTGHDGWKVVRINGSYYDNQGPQVVDVDGARSWNIGVMGAYSTSTGFSSASCFRTTTDGEMWFDRSYAHSSTLSAVAESNGKLYFRNSVLDGDTYTVGGGEIVEY